MALKLLFVFLSLWRVHMVLGKTSNFEDDLELERQLKILNKPPIKTFVTKEGETIDYVNINEQLSLDHPLLLKNHKIQGDAFHNGCFNTQCPGFVQTHREVTPNHPLTPTSTYGGDIYEVVVHVEQDRRTRNWWLVVRHDTAIGYWPTELFVNLSNGAKRVSWGGEGFSGNIGTCPLLGSGHMTDGKYNHAAYFCRIHYMTGSTANQTPLAVFEHVDKSKVYGLKNDRYICKGDMGYSFTYGGPGDQSCVVMLKQTSM